jgi:hypothetical protein
MPVRLRFVLFVVLVLGAPALLMGSGDPQLTDPGKMALILGPAVFGLALNPGFGRRAGRIDGRVVVGAGLTTLVIVGLALGVALATGAAGFTGPRLESRAAGGAVAATVLTSVLEELGWAVGGLALAVKALGRRWGVLVLGLAWAAWHLVPVYFRVGLFPDLEAAPPRMIGAFVLSCVLYRELMTRFVERSRTWLAAALAHAVPNILITALIVQGLDPLVRSESWFLFPAPGGVVFAAVVFAALVLLEWRSRRSP